jgi:hypothetical protein
MDGISKALKKEYPSHKVHIDKVKQGLNAPAFFIKNLVSGQEQKLDVRYQRNHSFDIHFFPSDTTGTTREIQKVAARLYMVLEYITLQEFVDGGTEESLIRGTGMNYETVDGVLHFFVDYNLFILKKIPEEPYMEDLRAEIKLRDGGD